MKNSLQHNILADENVDYRIVKYLRDKNYTVISILEDFRGISDKEVIELAKNKKAIVLTEDKDFGKWVFAHKEKTKGVIYLRYESDKMKTICNSLVYLLSKYGDVLHKKFAVITSNKIRMRDLT
ncbi:MAG: DUF5615 family PIN-like protein [Candidatus Brocadiaceae bacterium]|nr:DUF5615 family PIN-like protein [Candidatus Brocadiaceae bacterium]